MDKQQATKEKWEKRAAKMDSAGKNGMKLGGAMTGCGCLLTVFITIPIILIVIFML